jgi:hypothetical protein
MNCNENCLRSGSRLQIRIQNVDYLPYTKCQSCCQTKRHQTYVVSFILCGCVLDFVSFLTTTRSSRKKWLKIKLKVWWHDATLLVYFSYIITYIHSITFIQYIYPLPFAEVSLHLLIACKLSEKNLPGVSSRESNSGLPYSKPTRYQLSNAALY